MNTLKQLEDGAYQGATRLALAQELTDFPEAIFTLADTLEILDLSNNCLTSLPDDLHRLHRLKVLFVSNNHFTVLPAALGACKNLEMIGFKANRITHVPACALPAKLRWLILTDNAIESLPEAIGERPYLQKLMLAGNRLTALPDTLARCHNLQLLRISANQLTSFPRVLCKLPRLAWLAFAGNPFEPPAPLDSEWQVPKVRMDHLKCHDVLGRGASGVIWRASWRVNAYKMPKHVAVKVFHGSVTSDGYPRDELAIAVRVGAHANVVRTVGYVQSDEALAVVMKLIPSDYRNLGLPPSLHSCTRDTFAPNERLSLADIAILMVQMESVLAHLRVRQISHGDVYAHNALVNDEMQLLFGDFGAASYYGYLSEPIQQAIVAIEKRALGYFIEDLLSLCVDDQSQSALAQLAYWRQQASMLIAS
ncbi:leucine-rich repeat-containing protein kinase family protein [Marinagarivorans algicola]|uniref:leucine-rich repeat-containing protein kinase family protein n=1 Tax=Marinagarivorans algicola TaxID=1513270 RepID=UPI0006B9E82F|nr:leucine-rich repeat-containing protein kinase family protein [Marinagarivorans algicola]